MPNLIYIPRPEEDLPDSGRVQLVLSVETEDEVKARLRGGLIAAAKAEAGRRIDAIAPLWRQTNLLRDVGPGAPEFAAIDAVRAASNRLEALLAAASDDELAATWTGPPDDGEGDTSPISAWDGWPA